MAFDLLTLADALEASRLGAAMRGVRMAYPLANLVHLGGLVALVGAIGVLDLRVMGLGRRLHLPTLSRMLTPIAIGGLVLSLVSGALLFAADARPLLGSPVFQLKAALIILALVNAVVFRARFKDLERSSDEAPLAARIQAGASIGLWLAVAALGRLIAYV